MSSDVTDPTSPTPGVGALRSIVGLVGELDMDTAPLFTTAVEGLIAQGCRELVLDLAQLRFCDSMGLNAILRQLRQVKGLGGSLTVMEPPDQVKRLLSMAGLDEILIRHAEVGQVAYVERQRTTVVLL